MHDNERVYKFRAIFATMRDPIHEHFEIVAHNLDEAWSALIPQLRLHADNIEGVIVAANLEGLGDVGAPAPFEAPYVLDSPLWSETSPLHRMN